LNKKISVNEGAYELINSTLKNEDILRIRAEKISEATVIDAGINTLGSYPAGCFVTEACLGNLGKASITQTSFGGVTLPAITVETNYPIIATLGAQFAGWNIKVEKYFAMGSGPARALALKPKKIYDKIDYKDDSKIAVIVLETDKLPSANTLEYIANECKVELRDLYVLAAPTCSLVGSVQISGRIVETGIHKLSEVGFDIKKILHGWGMAPIAPLHVNSGICMGRTNDALLYGGITSYIVDYEDDDSMVEIASKAPSSESKDYGRPFYEVFKAANFNFYKIDPNLFAPAVVYINNIRSGKTYKFGKINEDVLIESLNIIQ
jgi:methenyltetrahydromethanopterin cyclohydrolase